MKEFFILINVACLCHSISTQNDVRLPPTLTKWPRRKQTWCNSGCQFTLECDAEGTPAVRYEWKKNSFHLNTNLSSIGIGSDGTITINRATETNEGYYQCFAKNEYGTTLSDMIHFRMAFIEPIAGPSPVLQKTAVEGMPFHIQADRSRGFPKLSHNWHTAIEVYTYYYDRLWPSERIQVADNGDLHFAYVLPADAPNGRVYRCTTSNIYSDRQTKTQLTVTKNPTGNISQFAPTVAFSTATKTVALVGKSIELRCFFYGYPQPMISWRGPTNVSLTVRYSIRSFNTTLFKYPADASDEGNYSCTASNTEGNITLTFRIRVEVEPIFNKTRDGPYNVNVTEGESVTFNCNAFAKPQAKIVWLQNGQPIDTDNPPERFAFSNDNRSLTIRDVCRDCVDRESKTDLMVIQCNVSNVHGYAFASGYLNVLMKTNMTIGGSRNVSVDFLEEKQFAFQCIVTSDPSTPVIARWYKIEPFGDLVRDEPPYIYVTNEFLIIMIDPNCSFDCAKYLGEYRCVGDNGYSREQQTITLAYQNPTEEEISKNEEPCAGWKIFLGTEAIGLILLLIGIFLGFHSQPIKSVNRRTYGRKLSNPHSMYECIDYDSVDPPLQRKGNNDRSIRNDYSMYEHVGYDSIDQVLEDMAAREGAATHSGEVDGYESIDAPQKETISTGRPMLDDDTMYGDNEHSVPQEEVTSNQKINQQQINCHESVQSESGKLPKSNERSESMNTYSDLNREVVNPNLDLGNSDLNSKGANPCLDPSTTEVNQYTDLDMKEVNQNMDLDLKAVNQYLDLSPKEVNQYLDLDPKEVNEYLDLDPKEVNQYLDLDPKEVNQYLDLDPKEVNQYLDLDPKEVNQYMDLDSKEVNQYLDLDAKEVNQYLDLDPKEVNQNMDMGPKEVNQYLDLDPKEVNQYMDLDSKEVNQYLDLDPKEVSQYLDLYPKEVNQYTGMVPKEVNLCLNLGSKEMDS